jgi:hypothetical protein
MTRYGSPWTEGNAYKRLSYADCLAIVPYEGGVVPKWAKPDAACLLKEVNTWPNNQGWTANEFNMTELWRKQLTSECGEDETALREVGGELILAVNKEVLFTT